MWFGKLKAKVFSFLADIRIYPGGFVLFGDSSYAIKGPDIRKVLNILRPGDVLLRRHDHYLGSIAIPGYWSHAAIYIGDDKVVHMLGNGITEEDILTFLRCDNVMILRHPDVEKTLIAVDKAKGYLKDNIQYDYEFDFRDARKFYCNELIMFCYDNPEVKKRTIDKYLVPEDLRYTVFQEVWAKTDV